MGFFTLYALCMENHPIPQNVTGFEFKLIGNMTIKQFAYVASGVFIGWLLYTLPILALIKFPIILLVAFIGFSLAFLPVEGRPLDVMLIHFIQALFTSNQYIFHMHVGEFLQTTSSQKPISPTKTVAPNKKGNLQQFLKKIVKPAKNKLDEKELAFLSNLATMQSLSPIIQSAPPPTQQAPKEEKTLQQQAIPIQTALPQEKTQEYKTLMGELEKARLQNEQLEKELAALKQSLANQQQPVPPPTPPQAPIVKRLVVKPTGKITGLPNPEVPNIIMGLIRDSRGNVLPNILVEVKDKDGNPVRAFKTNGFGQFISATPLLNGVYTLEFDDPQDQHKFDAMELTVTGIIIGAIEVTSIDQREELRKALFSQ